MQSVDIGDNNNLFFEYFNLKPQQITLVKREKLEHLWLSKDFKTKTIIHNNESIELTNTYDIQYSADQWYACDLIKYVDGKANLLNRGEGDSPTMALLAMTMANSKLLNESDLKYLKYIFS